jgi:H+-transporting ATPase
MADNAAPHHGGSATSSDATPPDHLRTTIPSSNFNSPPDGEKQVAPESKLDVADGANVADGEKEEDDEDDEDIDALIDDLESMDGHEEEEEDEVSQPGGARPVSEDLLQTDTRLGLTANEVEQRRRKFGLNQMKEEKENLILKFLMYFVGPIQFVMEVSSSLSLSCNSAPP